ncbi:hypothetical protein Tco_0583265, partial [Tanacetum coccineum]
IFEVNADLLRNALRITPKDLDHPFTLPALEKEIIAFNNDLERPNIQKTSILPNVIKLDATLGNLKFANKGTTYPVFRMAILMMMLNDDIKASVEYLEYLAKFKGSNPVKTRGKGLLTKQGVKIVVKRVSIPKRRRSETVVEEVGQSEEVVDEVDSDETEYDKEEPLVRRRPIGVVIGGEARKQSDEEGVDHSKKLKGIEISSEGSGVTPKVSDELTQKGLNEGSGVTLAVPDEPKDSSSSSSSASQDEIEDISKHIEDRGGNEQAGITQADVHVSEPQIEKHAATLIILKELVETEAQSMVDIPVQQAIPAEQIPPLVDTTDDTGAIDNRVTRLEKTVNAMSRFNLLEAIDKSVKAHLKNVMPKDVLDFADTSSSKKGQTQSKSSKSTKAPHIPSEAKKVVDEDIQPQDGVMYDTKMEQDANMVTDDVQQYDNAPNQDRSTWFKQDAIVRPEIPDPEWHKEPNDVTEQNWFNDMVNAEKGPITCDDIMGSVVDFTKFTKNCLQKDNITKANLEGPTFKLFKGNYKNYIELEYNFEQCYLALTDQIDWINPEGERVSYDLSKPLPLQGPPGLITIPVDFFFNKDLEYLKNRSTKRKYPCSLRNLKAARYDLEGIEEMIPNLWILSKETYDKNPALGISH